MRGHLFSRVSLRALALRGADYDTLLSASIAVGPTKPGSGPGSSRSGETTIFVLYQQQIAYHPTYNPSHSHLPVPCLEQKKHLAPLYLVQTFLHPPRSLRRQSAMAYTAIPPKTKPQSQHKVFLHSDKPKTSIDRLNLLKHGKEDLAFL